MNEEFIQMLTGFHQQENRAALAMLRRGLGKQPGEAMEVYRIIGNFAATAKGKREADLHTIATLYGLYPSESRAGNQDNSNFGLSVSELNKKINARTKSESIEKRFVALLNAHSDDLSDHLRQMVGLLKANKEEINWLQLLNDLNGWERDDREVQRRWAKSFQWKEK
jgi:CRISPR system Cascade subunit CasB